MLRRMYINMGTKRTKGYDISLLIDGENNEEIIEKIKTIFPGGTGLVEDNVWHLSDGGWVTVDEELPNYNLGE